MIVEVFISLIYFCFSFDGICLYVCPDELLIFVAKCYYYKDSFLNFLKNSLRFMFATDEYFNLKRMQSIKIS